MKLEQMKIKKRLRTGFGFVTLLAMLSAVVGIIALIVVSTRYEYALSHYGFSQGDVGKAIVALRRQEVLSVLLWDMMTRMR